ncbi:D-alanyl-D-alanine carboxypeptidase [Desulfitobacterium dichloroeliminans LMG P-21439]|uniref:D-alanyl-D-alanine carboxypeptidase n=1 Tax=Desulfitobacterium dichloroeliminans (strain LMG P-21439 / DCA1) TaxID=871963 RepID=L0F8H9_DESDL|nr:D-alanyl-D-alanine carboxypeptidase [Desulfitobacterium dichloroeliminans]AGA68961.1 D-alanyl-D-alanine carboxypeptidase [Desulfitobacterium dichloroeliminans LMG P-21439]
MVRKVRKKKQGIPLSRALPLLVIMAAIVYGFILTPGTPPIFEEEYNDKTSSYSSIKLSPDSSEDRTRPVSPSKRKTDPAVFISPNKLKSPCAILVRLKDHTIQLDNRSSEKVYPASLTKMMTALVAIENLPNLKEKIRLTHTAFQGMDEADASMAGFQPGEQVRAIDLLYGVMLPSGAECCIGLADQIAGSEQDFVKLMNQKAADIGMKSTHFENATGLHHENHYTTVNDLAILLSYALQNDTYREIFTSSRHSIPPTNKHPDGITLYSTLFEELNHQDIRGGEISGGKTGYTQEAGLCLASLAQVGKQEYILITAGAQGDHYSEQYNFTDALAVYGSISSTAID